MIQKPYKEGTQTMTPSADLVTRPELDATIESLNRELSGLNNKLDQVLSSKYEDAKSMGALGEQVRNLAESVKTQGESMRRMEMDSRKDQIAPRDAAIKFLYDALKLIAGAALGYFLSGGKWHT